MLHNELQAGNTKQGSLIGQSRGGGWQAGRDWGSQQRFPDGARVSGAACPLELALSSQQRGAG